MERKKIVIVEDDRFLRRVYEEKFKKIADYEIFVAADGASAVTMIKKEHPDLVLLDLVLPEMDGFTVLENVKKDPATADVPVIILSNLGQEDDIVRGRELGALDYLIKSDISIQAIEDKVRNILQLQAVKKPTTVTPSTVVPTPAPTSTPATIAPAIDQSSPVATPTPQPKIETVVPVTAPASTAAVFCSKCGASLPVGGKFCPQCGNKVG